MKNEMPNEKKYILAYGFRRLEACKKLGWKSISCFFKEEGITKDILIKDIEILRNSRIENDEESLDSLMTSIKQHGLLEPVGVFRINELSTEDFFILNMTENEQRRDITPLEFANGCRILNEKGLNISEIAARLSVASDRVKVALTLIKGDMAEHLKEADYIKIGNKKGGRLPISILNRISNFKMATKIQKDNLLREARKRELSLSQVDLICRLVYAGMDLNKAIKHQENYTVVYPQIVMIKSQLEKKKLKADTKTVHAILMGNLEQDEDLFYYNK
jgi:hypothetical protein